MSNAKIQQKSFTNKNNGFKANYQILLLHKGKKANDLYKLRRYWEMQSNYEYTDKRFLFLTKASNSQALYPHEKFKLKW